MKIMTEIEKNELKNELQSNSVYVSFVKKDGTIRKMLCTLSESKIPSEHTPKGTGKAKSADVLSVFDLEKSAWRSFRYDSITEISKNT
jgi:hypothetical protein